MNREHFEELNRADWKALDMVLDQLDRRGGQRTADRFPDLYRRVCYHLALVRHRRYGADLEEELNRLVMRGHRHLYEPTHRLRGGRGSILRFLAHEFPRQVRREKRLVLLATLLFFGPLLGTWAAVGAQPEVALSIVPGHDVEAAAGQFADAFEAENAAGAPRFLMFGFYVYNNVSIAFRTWASGLFLGIGSVFILVYNGLVIGAVGGYVHSLGYDENFLSFVVGHGALELPAIVLAGAAGLRLGLALLLPGPFGRWYALRQAARQTLGILAGTAAMLLGAAVLEAFWSPQPMIPTPVKYGVGAALWLAVPVFFLVAGRSAPARPASRPAS
ncbi:MAG TPA: stage II sporulation protein M [Thermoanaerobaculia bacterium]|nr:stage II sporulation protein M [Thermoanaerobaculia bacterium]